MPLFAAKIASERDRPESIDPENLSVVSDTLQAVKKTGAFVTMLNTDPEFDYSQYNQFRVDDVKAADACYQLLFLKKKDVSGVEDILISRAMLINLGSIDLDKYLTYNEEEDNKFFIDYILKNYIDVAGLNFDKIIQNLNKDNILGEERDSYNKLITRIIKSCDDKYFPQWTKNLYNTADNETNHGHIATNIKFPVKLTLQLRNSNQLNSDITHEFYESTVRYCALDKTKSSQYTTYFAVPPSGKTLKIKHKTDNPWEIGKDALLKMNSKGQFQCRISNRAFLTTHGKPHDNNDPDNNLTFLQIALKQIKQEHDNEIKINASLSILSDTKSNSQQKIDAIKNLYKNGMELAEKMFLNPEKVKTVQVASRDRKSTV